MKSIICRGGSVYVSFENGISSKLHKRTDVIDIKICATKTICICFRFF